MSKTCLKHSDGLCRCPWPGTDPLYVAYHDEEWGVPEWDSRALFEKLLLDGFQAGLSWITILRKRETYREAYHGFDPERIARYTPEDVERLMGNAGIVRNRLKIEGSILSARAYLEIEAKEGFSPYLWSFVGGKPIQNTLKTMSMAPTTSPEAEAMSKALKKAGFKFVGPTIIYAFMQAVGMVNDHFTDCYRYEACRLMSQNS
jgi:DNA-3-methyladenine glycosylase I